MREARGACRRGGAECGERLEPAAEEKGGEGAEMLELKAKLVRLQREGREAVARTAAAAAGMERVEMLQMKATIAAAQHDLKVLRSTADRAEKELKVKEQQLEGVQLHLGQGGRREGASRRTRNRWRGR